MFSRVIQIVQGAHFAHKCIVFSLAAASRCNIQLQ